MNWEAERGGETSAVQMWLPQPSTREFGGTRSIVGKNVKIFLLCLKYMANFTNDIAGSNLRLI